MKDLSATSACDPLVMDKGYRILQIHPTLQCNLTCLHCYSSSAPRLKKELSPDMLKSFLAEAYEHGYNAVSVSGGEPFLYSGLDDVLAFAKSVGYLTTVTTNGSLFRSKAAVDTLRHIDLLAFSIDGQPEHHNYMRNSPKAFDKLEEGIAIASDHIEKFGFIHTVTPKTLDSLLWLGDFARSKGGRLLQLHPLENAGRGKDLVDTLSLSPEDLQRIYIMSHYLQKKYKGEMLIELDLIHRDQIMKSPGSVYAKKKQIGYELITDFLRELILDENGYLLPVSHGFSRHYAIGNIHEGACLRSMADQFLADTLPRLQDLFDETFDSIAAHEEQDLLNWAEIIVNNSRRKMMETMLSF